MHKKINNNMNAGEVGGQRQSYKLEKKLRKKLKKCCNTIKCVCSNLNKKPLL